MVSRILLALAAFLLGGATLPAHDAAILVDASYSMSLEDTDGRSRLESLAAELERWIHRRSPDERYALLVADHESQIDVRLPYPATAAEVISEIRSITPWGSIDLVGAVENAASLAHRETGADPRDHLPLVVLTDGEDMSMLTGRRRLELPDRVRLTPILFSTSSPAAMTEAIRALADGTSHDTTAGPTAPGPSPTSAATAPQHEAQAQRDAAPGDHPGSRAGHGISARALLGQWSGIARRLFLAATLLGTGAALRAELRHRRRLERVVLHNARPPVVRLEMRGPSARHDITIDRYPRTVGTEHDHPDIAQATIPFTLSFRDGVVALTATDKVKINGMGRTEHELSERDQIRLGRVRCTVASIEPVTRIRPPRPTHRRYAIAPAMSAVLALLAFLTALPAHAPDLPGSAIATAASEATDLPEPSIRLPETFGPGDRLPSADLDYLVVHSHPDDEAIDFGALVARLAAGGRSGAVLLITDGEAGRDQYPWRGSDDRYPAYDLTGKHLAAARIREARQAIGMIGADLYIRLGLENHPYNSVVEARTIEEVLSAWGGRETLARRLARIVERLRPEIVLSPDGPSRAYEHFEHEAAGLLVADALRIVRERGQHGVLAHLVSVDPLQSNAYASAVRISPWEPAPDGSIPRIRQLLALRAHRTQCDATIVGVETRLALADDIFSIAYAAPGFDLAAVLDGDGIDLAAAAP
ncbi:MAG: PIG-L family deacetylase [Spirochaetota bacterium]